MLDKNGNECYFACVKDIDLEQSILKNVSLLIYDEEHKYEWDFDIDNFEEHLEKVLLELDKNTYLHIMGYHW